MEHAVQQRRRHRFGWQQITLWIVLLLVIALLGARLYLPVWLKDYVNEQLNSMPGYRGSVSDIGVQLFRGAYTIKGLEINKIDKGIPVPFLSIVLSDISLQWGALIHGRIVSDVHLTRPVVNFAVSQNGVTKQTGADADWQRVIKNLVPIDINLLEIDNGKVTYRDFSTDPKVDLYITNLYGTLTNMRNVVDIDTALPSSIDITGDSIGRGKLGVKGRMNVLAPQWIDMDIDGKLESAQLPAFNDFTEACCALDFKGGILDVYAEMAVRNGNVTGYVKPLVRDLSVDRIPEETNPIQMAWSAVASGVIEIFTNQSKDQFATKVPLSGNLGHVETSIWPTLGGIVRNAFFEAFRKGTDDEIKFEKKKKAAIPQQ
jgi:hypothetical protein